VVLQRARSGFLRPSLRARVLMHTGLQLGGKAVTLLAGVLLLSLLTRYLGVRGFGRYTFVLGFTSLFAVLTDLGSQALAVREMARHRDRADRVAGQYFTVKAAMGAASALAAVVLSLVLPVHSLREPGVVFGIVICAVALLAAPLGGTAIAVFQTALRMEIPVLSDVMARLLMLAGVAALAAGLTAKGASPAMKLDLVLLISAATGVIGAIVIFFAAQRFLHFRPVLYDRLLLWPMVRDSAPLAIVLVVGIIHYRIDVFILAAMKGSSAVGLYGVATKLPDVSLAVSAMFMSVAFPVLSQRAAGEQAPLRRAFQKSLEFMLILGAGIAIFAAVLSPTLARLVGGSGFGDAAAPLAVIAFAIPVMFVNQVFSHMVVAANRQLIGVPVVLSAALANVVLNVLLIPHLGVTAPALVTDITESLSAIGLAVVMIRHYRFAPSLLTPARILAAAALAGSATLVVRGFNPYVAAVLGLAVYATALVLTGAIGRDDVTALLRGEAPA